MGQELLDDARQRPGWSSARGRWRCGMSREGSYPLKRCPIPPVGAEVMFDGAHSSNQSLEPTAGRSLAPAGAVASRTSIIGDFIDYLLARHQSRILAIHIMRRLRESE